MPGICVMNRAAAKIFLRGGAIQRGDGLGGIRLPETAFGAF